MSIPTEPIGSIPRPAELMAAWADRQAGRIPIEQFSQIAESALKDTIRRFEETGSPVITDGEQTKSSFATYPLDGASGLATDGVVVPFEDGHTRQLPRLISGPFRYATHASTYLATAQRLTTRPLKQAVISASALSLPRKAPSCLLAALLFAIAHPIRGQDAIMNPGSRDTNATPWSRLNDLADFGFSFPMEIYAESLGNLSGGTSRRLIWESEWDVGVAIDLEKAVGWHGTSAIVRGLYAQGSGLTNAAVHDFNTLSNIDAYDSLRLYERLATT